MSSAFKILMLSIIVAISILLAVYFLFEKEINVQIYLDIEDGKVATATELVIDYNDRVSKFISNSQDGLLKNIDNKRFVIVNSAIPNGNPLISFKFKVNRFLASNIKVSEDSIVYISKSGPANIPSSGINYRLVYE